MKPNIPNAGSLMTPIVPLSDAEVVDAVNTEYLPRFGIDGTLVASMLRGHFYASRDPLWQWAKSAVVWGRIVEKEGRTDLAGLISAAVESHDPLSLYKWVGCVPFATLAQKKNEIRLRIERRIERWYRLQIRKQRIANAEQMVKITTCPLTVSLSLLLDDFTVSWEDCRTNSSCEIGFAVDHVRRGFPIEVRHALPDGQAVICSFTLNKLLSVKHLLDLVVQAVRSCKVSLPSDELICLVQSISSFVTRWFCDQTLHSALQVAVETKDFDNYILATSREQRHCGVNPLEESARVMVSKEYLRTPWV